MKNATILLYSALSFFTLSFFMACNGQEKSMRLVEKVSEPQTHIQPKSHPDIAGYIRHIFQDKNGNFWFGTNGFGTAHYDGDSVTYYSNAQGFGGQQITGITEDLDGNIWFATDQGIVAYNWATDENGNKRFVNYPSRPTFKGERFWSIYADSKGVIWAGGVTGIFRFDGILWTSFDLPYPEEIKGEFITGGTTWGIEEDGEGNMWFSTNGYGVFKYDGKTFTQYSEQDGLTDNSVDEILEDSQGNMWFGTRNGGLSRFDGSSFTNFTDRDSIGNNEVCAVFEDSAGNVWFSSEGYGVYKYNGGNFTNYFKDEGLGVKAVQSIYEDRLGRIWVGGGGGLYRFDGMRFSQVKREGPWD